MYKIAEHILYEDDKLLVCVKPAGIAVQTKRMGEQDMESLLRNYLVAKGETPFIDLYKRQSQCRLCFRIWQLRLNQPSGWKNDTLCT